MEKDKKIEQLIRESGLESPSENFTVKLMERIHSIPVRRAYKPLIGRFGQFIILSVILVFITISIIYSEPSGFLTERSLNLPQLDFKIPELPDLNFSKGFLATLMAVFILVVADNLFRKRRLLQ